MNLHVTCDPTKLKFVPRCRFHITFEDAKKKKEGNMDFSYCGEILGDVHCLMKILFLFQIQYLEA